jgi:DNA-binding SARP family transcriptional activator/streptogramin lyase
VQQRLSFLVLGELDVLAGGTPVPLGGAKQRALLAVLLLERKLVSTDHLIEAIWSGSPPPTALKSIQVYVSGLRKVLGEERILTRGRGYELVVETGEVDVDVFDDLVRGAAGAPPDVAAPQLREALALVRGHPLGELALDSWAAPEVGRIEERVLAATEARIEADLELGRHAEVASELETLTAAHPYRERLLELLMLAMYRSGRQADALGAYRRGAGRLRDELGLEPGRPLQQLEASILRQDPALDAPPSAQRVLAARRRGWKLATVGALMLLLAAFAAVAIAVARGDAASLESLPAGVAIISIADGSLVEHFPLTEIAQPVEVVTGSGSFWVSNLDPASTIEIDPATGGIVRRVGSAFPGEPGWPLPDGGVIWFAGQNELARVHLADVRAVDRFTLVRERHRFGLAGLTRCAGSLWVASNTEGQVLRVDPRSGEVIARLPIAYPWAIGCGNGGLWVTSVSEGIRRIDPQTNTFVATADVPPPHEQIAIGGGYAWTTNETNGTLYKIGSDGTIVATYQTGDGARQLSFDDGTVWVANGDAGTVTGIDAATGAERTFRFGHPVLSVAGLEGRLLVELASGRTYEDRIDDLEGDVAKIIVPTYVFDPPDPALAWNPWIHTVEASTCSQLLRHSVGDGLPGDELVPDLATGLPRVSDDGRTYTFTVASGRVFAPPSNRQVTAAAVRFSIERALSKKLTAEVPAMRFLGDLVGAREYNAGTARRVRGIRVAGAEISFTLVEPSEDFLERISLPFFCVVPVETPSPQGGLPTVAPPSAGPYYMTERFNGEYTILKPNPNYSGPREAQLDAIAFREGLSDETAVGRVESGAWDGAVLWGSLLEPDGLTARRAASDSKLRHEVLPIRGIAYEDPERIFALLSSRLGCDELRGALDLAALCLADPDR